MSYSKPYIYVNDIDSSGATELYTIRYDKLFAPENWQANGHVNLQKLKMF